MSVQNESRRQILKTALVAAVVAPILGQVAEAAAPAALDPADPTAKALGYVVDSAKVDAKANPTHKPEQKCANCAQFKGAAGQATGACTIFAGKTVAAKGWCRAYAAAPAAKK